MAATHKVHKYHCIGDLNYLTPKLLRMLFMVIMRKSFKVCCLNYFNSFSCFLVCDLTSLIVTSMIPRTGAMPFPHTSSLKLDPT
jgi:hypothetical protein